MQCAAAELRRKGLTAALPIMHGMLRLHSDRAYPLHDTAATRAIENESTESLPPHTLMQRAGYAITRLARALAPHAQQVWVLCGPGNNGGDGLEAAATLQSHGIDVTVTWLGDETTTPPDALCALQRARCAGVRFADAPPTTLMPDDLCVDALLGIGLAQGEKKRSPPPLWIKLLHQMRASPATVLNVDIPSGLQADTGAWSGGFEGLAEPSAFSSFSPPIHTLALLTLKPGLLTAQGKDAAGTLWLDDLGTASEQANARATAWLAGPPPVKQRAQASHKGSYGDLAIVGGEGLARRGMGMEGAALLAGSAALHAGTGRVLVVLLDDGALHPAQWMPELMQRRFDVLELTQLTVVCGCGGGDAVREVLPKVLAQAPRLVLDADALNAIAQSKKLKASLKARAAQGYCTVLTPHPLEAARLLGCNAQTVQLDRLACAYNIAKRFDCICVLKGSGTVIAAPMDHLPHINPTGNARLATAGTGDVLAGMVGARLAAGEAAFNAACHAVYAHGRRADQWPNAVPLTASALANEVDDEAAIPVANGMVKKI